MPKRRRQEQNECMGGCGCDVPFIHSSEQIKNPSLIYMKLIHICPKRKSFFCQGWRIFYLNFLLLKILSINFQQIKFFGLKNLSEKFKILPRHP
jgi:hypothetical protein